jgi:3-hydroxyacyl-[acyl-carrier-protein] dehydratase
MLDGLDAMVRSGVRKALWQPSASARTVDVGRSQIEQLLPHRDPFLFVDRITDIDLEHGRLRGERSIDAADPVFAGHFPAQPVYPGVLLLETMGQFGLCLLHFVGRRTYDVTAEIRPRDFRATRIHHTAFLAGVGPGDRLEVSAAVVMEDDYRAVCAGQILRDGTICVFGVLEVFLVDP